MITLGNVVAHLGVIGQGLKSVSEARGNVQHRPIVGAELHADPLAARVRLRPHVHRHVEDGAARARDQLGLLVRGRLEMQAP